MKPFSAFPEYHLADKIELLYSYPKQKPQEGTFFAYETAAFPADGFLPALFISSFQSRTGRGTAHDLEDAGMENLRFDQYSVGMDENTVGTAMGIRKIGSGTDAFSLVAVAVCGGRYGNESSWRFCAVS